MPVPPELRTDPSSDTSMNHAAQLRRWLPRFKWAWLFHFLLTLLPVLYGIYVNGGTKKYYPVVHGGLESCEKAFVNVLASSTEDFEAVVCCDGNEHSTSSICSNKPNYFLSGSLARFPGAWILPLTPIAFRLLYTFIANRLSTKKPQERLSTTLLRFSFYIATMNFRGWILYVWLGYLESLVVMPVGDECWYKDLMPQPSCHARIFDFSDHTVLYMAQILPLPLLETLHSLACPFWSDASSRTARWPIVLLWSGLAYLYVITLLGQFKTSAYFHTGGEIVAGYIISLIVQLPYATLQCFPRWQGMRLWLFGYPLATPQQQQRRD